LWVGWFFEEGADLVWVGGFDVDDVELVGEFDWLMDCGDGCGCFGGDVLFDYLLEVYVVYVIGIYYDYDVGVFVLYEVEVLEDCVGAVEVLLFVDLLLGWYWCDVVVE